MEEKELKRINRIVETYYSLSHVFSSFVQTAGKLLENDESRHLLCIEDFDPSKPLSFRCFGHYVETAWRMFFDEKNDCMGELFFQVTENDKTYKFLSIYFDRRGNATKNLETSLKEYLLSSNNCYKDIFYQMIKNLLALPYFKA